MNKVATFVLTLLFIFALYNIDKVDFSILENRALEYMASQEPPFSYNNTTDQPYLMNGEKAFEKPVIDIEETIKHKKASYLAFKEDTKKTFSTVSKLVAFSVERTNPAYYFTVDPRKLTEQMYLPEIGNNLTNTLVDLYDMLTTRVVMVENHPYVMKSEVVWTKQIAIPFFNNTPSTQVVGKPRNRVLQWENEILAVSNKYNIEPAVIAAVIEQESGGDPNALSRTGAIGLMQLMPGTARGLGVNPFDPGENIEGGAKYLSIQIKRFGDLELALAAYNAGPNAVESKKYLRYSETKGYITNIPNLIPKYQQYFSNLAVNAQE